MKKLIICLIMLMAVQVFADNEKSIVNSDIKDVRVYLYGAQINRTFKTIVESGVTQLVIENLSSLIDENSITAELKGEAMVLNTSFSLDYLKENRTTPELKKLKDSLEVLTDDLNDLKVMESVYNEEVSMLNTNKEVGGSNVGVNAENLKKVIDFFRQRMTELKGNLLALNKKQLKLNEKIKRIKDQMEVENGKLKQPSGAIIVNVSARQKANIEITLSYFATGASWKPSYDLRAKDVSSQVNLTYKAIVAQQTGEDWENVRLSLSTGNPSLNGTKPQLIPWYLRFVSPYILQGAGARKQNESAIMNSAEEPAMTKNLMSDQVEMQENQIVTEFEILLPYTVLTTGKEVLIDIQSHNLPASYAYYSTPKLDRDVFLIANITGWEKLNLLPGNANVYLENSYVGQSYINPSVTTDTLQLSFGRDKRIVVKREQVKDMNTTKFFGGNVEKEFLFETSIKNSKKESITITIEDQLPLSTDQDIKISTGELSGGNYNSETGMISWKFDVKPGETKKTRLGYKIKYPKDKIIGGL